jgi:hypothetical protein
MTRQDTMQKKSRLVLSFVTNLGLLLTESAVVFTGFKIQLEYHMGHHGSIDKGNLV